MDGLRDAGIGWLLAGFFLGWLGNWLFDRLYRRDGGAGSVLSELQRDALSADLRKLDAGLAERDARIDQLQAELRSLADRLAAEGEPPSPGRDGASRQGGRHRRGGERG